MNLQVILLVNLASTWYLVGLIWLVQIVHYPLFSRVGNEQFAGYERQHSSLITPVVGLPMAVELFTAGLLCFAGPETIPRWMAIAGLMLVFGIWISTAILQSPCHTRLLKGFDERVHRFLLISNWLRTILWTARGLLMALAVLQRL